MPLLRHALPLAAGRVGLLAASAVSVHLTTRLLGPSEVGRLQLILAATGVAALLLSGCSLFFYRHAAAWLQGGTLRANLHRYALLLTGAAGVAATVPWLLPQDMLPSARGWLALLLAGNLLVATLQQALLHLVNLLSLRSAYALLGNAVAWGGLAIAAGLAGWAGPLGARAEGWLLGLLAAQALALVPLALLLAPRLRGAAAPAAAAVSTPSCSARAMLRFAWPLCVAMGLYAVQRSLPLPWLAAAQDVASVGRWAVGFSLGMLAMLAFDTLARELFGPRHDREMAAAQADPAAQVRAWERYAAALLPGATAAAICTAAAGPSLLAALADPAFHDAARWVAWGAACQWLLSVQGMVQLQAAGVQDNRVLLLPHAAGAAATVAMLSLALPVEPALQAAGASVAGPLVGTGLAAWRVRRLHRARWPWRRIALGAAAALPALGLAALPATGAALLAVAAFGAWLQWQMARSWLLQAEAR